MSTLTLAPPQGVRIAMEAFGDAMAPTIRDGDVLIVDTSDQALREAVYVLLSGSAAIVRRIGLRPTGECVVICDNPRYASETVDSASISILGRVVWKGGRL